MRQQLWERRQNLALMEETSCLSSKRAGRHQCSTGLTERTGGDTKTTTTSEEGRRSSSNQLWWKWMCLQLFWKQAFSSFLTLFPWWLNLILVTLVLPGLLKQRICWEWPHSNILTLPSWAPVKSEKQNSRSFSVSCFRHRGWHFWLL